MRSRTYSSPKAALVLAALAAGIGTLGCQAGKEDPGELLVSKLIGPEGGSISGGGLSLTFPPFALGTETEIEIRSSKVNLSAADFKMQDTARALLPAGLSLRLPVALNFSGAKAVLFQQDELTVAALGATGYLNELSVVAAASAGTPRITTAMPVLGASPQAAGAALRDQVHFQMQVQDTPEMDLSLTIYDTAQAYDRSLNGTGSGECGFRLEPTLTGGSLAGGCNEGFVTATIRTSSQAVDFDITPFLSGNMTTPVTVGVVAGGPAIAYQLGFFAFDTSPCYDETCSGNGVCVANGSEATCECVEGHAAQGLTCVCVPQCEGRECGNDSCGGQCGDCGDGEGCNDEAGQCVTNPPDTGTDGTDTGMETGDTGMDGSSGTSTGGDGMTSTTSDPTTGGGSSTGMGSSSTG